MYGGGLCKVLSKHVKVCCSADLLSSPAVGSVQLAPICPTPDAAALPCQKPPHNRHFFFELRANERGQYMKVKEVSGNMKNLLVIPIHGTYGACDLKCK